MTVTHIEHTQFTRAQFTRAQFTLAQFESQLTLAQEGRSLTMSRIQKVSQHRPGTEVIY